jgi:hypothetical protein
MQHRALTVALLLGALAPAVLLIPNSGPAAAGTPNAQAGVVYPITSFLDWAMSPLDNITSAPFGEYFLTQELDNAQASVLTQFPNALNPSALLGPNGPADAVAFSEEMTSQLAHLRPQVATDNVTDVANPDFLPDFDHNGTYGDPGDFVAMTDSTSVAGYFLYPCLSDDGSVTYETTGGNCAAPGTVGDTFKEGVAQRESIVDSRGLALSATLWLPATALRKGCPSANPDATPCAAPQGLAPKADLDGGKGLPAVVLADGIASDQDSYFWLAMALARAGNIVLTYDPAGQGDSEGSAANLFTPSAADCEFGGACRDLQDVMRWLVGDPITPVVNLTTANPIAAPSTESNSSAPTSPDIHNPAYTPRGSNRFDQARGVIDDAELAIAGHSMGALSLLNYLWYQGRGTTGIDGNPIPPIATGIALSGAAPTTATVPIQFQTSDYDGSPILLGPSVGAVDLGAAGDGIGYADMKPLYDQLRTSGPGNAALSLIIMEGGVHTDFVDTPYITRTPWSLAVSAHYATAWMDCFLQHNGADCLTAVSPVAHLSSSFASEASPSGPFPRSSHCITIPTTASLNDSPAELLQAEEGSPTYTCGN